MSLKRKAKDSMDPFTSSLPGPTTNLEIQEVPSSRASKRSTPLPGTPQAANSVGSSDEFSDYEDEASGTEAGRLNSESSRFCLLPQGIDIKTAC
jgi:hypothetical protein